jgi:hypothetical protein
MQPPQGLLLRPHAAGRLARAGAGAATWRALYPLALTPASPALLLHPLSADQCFFSNRPSGPQGNSLFRMWR